MLQMVKKTILLCVTAAVFSGCDSLDIKGLLVPTSQVVGHRFDQSIAMTSDKAIATIEVGDEYTFYVCTDPHINETSVNLDQFNAALRNDPDADFGVQLGDCTDKIGKLPRYMESIEYKPDVHKYNYPIFTILGNHDLFFDGWGDYKSNVGPSVYRFETKSSTTKDLYLVLDTATGTLGSKQTKWLKNFLTTNRSKYRYCVILTHTNIFNTDHSQNTSGNLNFDETFELMDFLSKNKVNLVLQGHDHYREDLTFNGVRYTTVGTIRDEIEAPEYLRVKVTDKGLQFIWELM